MRADLGMQIPSRSRSRCFRSQRFCLTKRTFLGMHTQDQRHLKRTSTRLSRPQKRSKALSSIRLSKQSFVSIADFERESIAKEGERRLEYRDPNMVSSPSP